MDMQFDKKPLQFLRKIVGQLRSQEQTSEVRLPDGLPDIGRVLGAWGQVIVRSKEWNSDRMTVSCGVMAWVLYAPEDEDGVRSVEAWLPFSMNWDLPDTKYDGKIMVSCQLHSVDARSISARKLMVRASLGALAEAWLQGEEVVSVPGDVPEDVKILTSSYPLLLPKEAGEKAFLLEEQVDFPASGPKAEKLLHYSLHPEIVDKKVMAGKVVFRGTAVVHLLYRGEDGSLCTWDYEFPFSQYADLDGEYEEDATIFVQPCVTSLDMLLSEDGSLQIKAGILGQYLLYERSVLAVAEDAYSLRRTISLKQEELQIPAVLDQVSQVIHGEQTVREDVQRIVDLAFFLESAYPERAEDSVSLSIPGQFQMLYYDPEGELRCVNAPWKGEWSQRAAEACAVDMLVIPTGKPMGMIGAGSVNLRMDLTVNAATTSGQGFSMITGMEMGEAEKPDPNRPSLILRRKGSDRLWDVAKKTNSTVEAIMTANQLDGEPGDDCVLLIPVP